MDRLKTFALYAIMLIGFFIFSEILINVGLNSNYNNIEVKGEIPAQIQVDRAEATLVNGRILGTIQNSTGNDLNGKYIKIDVYSPREVLLGTKYLQISNLAPEAQDNFEVYFKAQDVEYYSMELTDVAPEVNKELDIFISEDMKMAAIVGAVVALILL